MIEKLIKIEDFVWEDPTLPRYYWNAYSLEERIKWLRIQLIKINKWIHDFIENFNDTMDGFEERCKAIEKRIEELLKRIDYIIEEMNNADDSMDELEDLLNYIKELVDDVTNRMNIIENEFNSVNNKFVLIENRIDKINEQFEEFESKLEEINNYINEITDEINDIKTELNEKNGEVDILEEKVNDLSDGSSEIYDGLFVREEWLSGTTVNQNMNNYQPIVQPKLGTTKDNTTGAPTADVYLFQAKKMVNNSTISNDYSYTYNIYGIRNYNTKLYQKVSEKVIVSLGYEGEQNE